MFFRIKIHFALTVVLLLFACAGTPESVSGQTTPQGNAAADKAAADKAAADKAAAEKAAANKAAVAAAAIQTQAMKEAAEKQAAKEAEENAAKRAEKKKKFEDTPLSVICIEPYVEPDEKGTCDPGDAKKAIPGKAGIGDRIKVVIPQLSEAAEYEVVEPTKLVLFIDGRVFPGVYPESVGYDSVIYKLERTKDAIDAWNGLLGSPGLEPVRPVVVSVGYANQKPLELAKDFPQKTNLNLVVYRKRWAVGSLIVMILMLLVLWKYGKDMLRDSGPPTPKYDDDKDNDKVAERPFSLAKVQVAWWFLLVVGCFLLIYLVTGEFTMTEQALILIGIGTGTALGSAMIENSKRASSDSELEQLLPQSKKLEDEISSLRGKATITETKKATITDTEKATLAEKKEQLAIVKAKIKDADTAKNKPISVSFWDDLVTDANGPSFHRFQMIAWTVILGILFLAAVYKNLAMPEFSGTMLALMGISAGTYLGFKIPEKQNQGNPETDENDDPEKKEKKKTDPVNPGAKKPDTPVTPGEPVPAASVKPSEENQPNAEETLEETSPQATDKEDPD